MRIIQSDRNGAVLAPPQFGLRALLLAMAACAALFALMAAIGASWSLVLVLFLSLAAAHVIGNALGSGLTGAARRSQQSLRGAAAFSADTHCEVPPKLEPSQRLTECAELGRGTRVAAGYGAVAGALIGSAALACLDWRAMGPTGLLLGTVSSAVVGGWAAFLLASFWTVARSAWTEALAPPVAARSGPRSQATFPRQQAPATSSP